MILCLWPQCNNRCLMCTNPPDFYRQADLYEKDKILGRIRVASQKEKQPESLLLTGGEPTIHPNFLEILAETRKLLPETQIKILTNGRTFFYENFAREVLATPNLSLTFSFCGPRAEVHDAVVRSKGSFEQAAAGLKNVLRRRLSSHHVEIRIVLTRILLRENKEMFEWLEGNFAEVDTIVFLFPEIEGICEENLEIIVPTYEQVLQSDFFKNFQAQRKNFKDLRLYHFPLCVVPANLWGSVWRTMDAADVGLVKKCQKCLYSRLCLGIPVGYEKFFGTEEFAPLLTKKKIKTTNDKFHPIGL